jgi:hypothetical protein
MLFDNNIIHLVRVFAPYGPSPEVFTIKGKPFYHYLDAYAYREKLIKETGFKYAIACHSTR